MRTATFLLALSLLACASPHKRDSATTTLRATTVEHTPAQAFEQALEHSDSISVVPDVRGGAIVATEYGAWYIGPRLGVGPVSGMIDRSKTFELPAPPDAKILMGLWQAEHQRSRRLKKENRALRQRLRYLEGDRPIGGTRPIAF